MKAQRSRPGPLAILGAIVATILMLMLANGLALPEIPTIINVHVVEPAGVDV